MGVLARLKNLLQDQGVLAVATKLVGRRLDLAYERSLGIDTVAVRQLAELEIVGENASLGHYYEGTRLMPLRSLVPRLQKMVPESSAFVDCGCGKGKALLVAGECGLHEVRGVEFAPELCEIARSNWQRLCQKKRIASKFEVICSDILDYEIRDNDSLFFLFNPFEPEILDRFAMRLVDSLQKHPRKIVLAFAFMSDAYKQVIAKYSDFSEVDEVVLWACRFTILMAERQT